MTPRKTALRLLAVVLAVAALGGCGIGEGASDDAPATLLVTRDFGSRELVRERDRAIADGTTVIRLLDRHAEIETRYGGGFVQSINGLAGSAAGGNRPRDWFFYVNGIESSRGGRQVEVNGGDVIWWDYREWGEAMRVPGVVGSWPEPFAHGAEGKRFPTRIDCLGSDSDCRAVLAALEREGVGASIGVAAARAGKDLLRIVVGPWQRVRDEEAARSIEDGPADSGVFARFSRAGTGWRLELLDREGSERQVVRGGLVAAVGREDSQPIWLVTGTDDAGVAAAARSLTRPKLRSRYAVAVAGGRTVGLPLR